MAEYLSKEKVKEIFKEYAGSEDNTGSAKGQVALFTYRIKGLSEHLQRNKKDHSSRRTLLSLVGKRKRLLNFIAKRDINEYRALIEQLGLRK